MKTYVMMTKIAPNDAHLIEITHGLQNHNKSSAKWMEEVKKLCPEVNVLAHYALLGPYDFMCIYEAPDERVAAKISLMSRARGAYQVESWNAIPTKEVMGLLPGVLKTSEKK